MKLYNELAGWWHLLSSPHDYEEEASLYRKIIGHYKQDINSALELGSGGGNNAFHLKKFYTLTLTDISSAMISMSQQLNPECEHIIGDMREINLGREFDLVFIHDAIMYITTEEDLKKVFEVAHRHLKKDGILFIAPDFFAETFQPYSDHGGHDDGKRGIRYLEWTTDGDPRDNKVETNFAYLLKDEGGNIRVEHDTAVEGLFPKKTWQNLLTNVGFEVHFEPINHSDADLQHYFGIICIRR